MPEKDVMKILDNLLKAIRENDLVELVKNANEVSNHLAYIIYRSNEGIFQVAAKVKTDVPQQKETQSKIFKELKKLDPNKVLVNLKDGNGKLPIEVAIENGNVYTLKELLKAGAKTNVLIGEKKQSVFQFALSFDNPNACLDALIERNLEEIDITKKQKTKQIFTDISNYVKEFSENYKKAIDEIAITDADGNNFLHSVINTITEANKIIDQYEHELSRAEAAEKKEEITKKIDVIKDRNQEKLTWLKDFLNTDLIEKANEIVDQYITQHNLSEEEAAELKEKIAEKISYTNEKFNEYKEKAVKQLFDSISGKGQDIIEYIIANVQDKTLLEELISLQEIQNRLYLEQGETSDGIEMQTPIERVINGDRVADQCILLNNTVVSEVIFKENATKILDDFINRYKNDNGKITNKTILRKLAQNYNNLDNNNSLSKLIDGNIVSKEDILILAVEENNKGLVNSVLTKHGNNIDFNSLKNKNGRTPLEEAIINGRTEIAQLLINNESAKIMLSQINETTGETVLHLAAKHTPDLVKEIMDKLDNVDDLLNIKDKNNKTAAQIAFTNGHADIVRPLIEGITPKIDKDQEEIFYNARDEAYINYDDFNLIESATNGKIEDLKEIFKQNPDNIYKTFGDDKSLLEVAADNNQGNVVRLIISEHKKLQKRKIELDGKIENLEGIIQGLTEEREKTNRETEKQGFEVEKTSVEAKITTLGVQIKKTALDILPKQKGQPWHKDILDASNLDNEYIENHCNDPNINPLYEALQNDNDIVADYFADISPELKEKEVNDSSPHDLLSERGDVDILLKYDLDLDNAYERDITQIPTNTAKLETQLEERKISTKEVAKSLFKQDLEKNKKSITGANIDGKGALTIYITALLNDKQDGTNFGDKLSKIKDKDKSLVELSSDDGHTIGTLTAAFGTTVQWEKYEDKYSALEAKNKPSRNACDDTSSILGTPIQVAVLAKKFSEKESERISKSLLINYFFDEKSPSLTIQNQDGENLLHTIVKCGDFETLNKVFETYDINVIKAALTTVNNNKTPLQVVIESGETQLLQHLTQYLDKNLDSKSYKKLLLNSNLLHTAVLSGNTFALKLILQIQKALNIQITPEELKLQNQKDEKDRNPFELAVIIGNESVIDEFINEGLMPNQSSLENFINKEIGNIQPEILDKILTAAKFDEEKINELKNQNDQAIQQKKEESKGTEKIEKIKLEKLQNKQEILDSCKNLAEKDVTHQISSYKRTTIQKKLDFINKQKELKNAISSDIDKAIEIIRSNPLILESQVDGQRFIDLVLENGNSSLLITAVQNYKHNLTDDHGNTLLHKIAQLYPSNVELTNKCLENGASVLTKNPEGKNSLDILTESKPDPAALMQLLQEPMKKSKLESELEQKVINALNQSLSSVLNPHEDDIEKLSDLLKENKNYYATTPVLGKLVAECFKPDALNNREDILRRRFELLSKLIKTDIPLNEADEKGNNILHQLFSNLVNTESPVAREYANTVVESIIKNKNFSRDLLFARNQSGVSPMHILAQVKDANNIWDTIKESKIRIQDEVDLSDLLMVAAACNNIPASDFLFKNYYQHIDINSTDGNSNSILGCAILNGNIEIANYLLQNGADINQVDRFGRNLLQIVLDDSSQGKILRNEQEIIKLLVQNGINLKNKDKQNLSAIDRIEKIEDHKDKLRDRVNELASKEEELTTDEVTELKKLNSLNLDVNYLSLLNEAQKTRVQEEESIKKTVYKYLYKSPENVIGSFLYEHGPKKLGSMFTKIKEEDFQCSKVGGNLHISTKNNTAVNVSGLLNSSQDISKLTLSFNGGLDQAEVQKHPRGPRNYIVKKGSVNITAELKVDGKKKEVTIKVYENGKIEFDNEKNKELFDQGKIDFTNSGVYVGGKILKDALKEEKWKKITSQNACGVNPINQQLNTAEQTLTDITQSLNEAGMRTGGGLFPDPTPTQGQTGGRRRSNSLQ